ncbi:hypothetical protein B0H17DRAFT_1218853 [Mycena rosella]|uniref:Tat pathway signal sequence n=1 Tax=Mycena rosella TaxID=1033263 RepID=A0AAD7BM78_MYCRO|nr:hypothetical protein B0H17DRAFT_1218853 [Mycena rosella]
MSKHREYHPLRSEPSDEFDDVSSSPVKPSWTSRFTRRVLVGLLAAETVVLAIAIFARAPHTVCTVPLNSQRVLYSPALEAVEQEVRVYHTGLPGRAMSPFQIPSSPALDQMWSDLYNFGMSRITKDEALDCQTRLPPSPETTATMYAVIFSPMTYLQLHALKIAELDVFHSLHCLNMIRMALDPDYYPDWRISTTNNLIPSQKDATEHVCKSLLYPSSFKADTSVPGCVAHCMEWMRQVIMCAGDTSVIVWQWRQSNNSTMGMANVAHTCRKFDKLQDWAKEHALKIHYDDTVHIEDDIVIPIFHNEI